MAIILRQAAQEQDTVRPQVLAEPATAAWLRVDALCQQLAPANTLLTTYSRNADPGMTPAATHHCNNARHAAL